jgi:hypothetical protein
MVDEFIDTQEKNNDERLKRMEAMFLFLGWPKDVSRTVVSYAVLTLHERAFCFFTSCAERLIVVPSVAVSPGQVSYELLVKLDDAEPRNSGHFFVNHFLLVALTSSRVRARFKMCDIETFVNWLLDRKLAFLFPNLKSNFVSLQDSLFQMICDRTAHLV